MVLWWKCVCECVCVSVCVCVCNIYLEQWFLNIYMFQLQKNKKGSSSKPRDIWAPLLDILTLDLGKD
jgi:hypothetical protein